MVVLLLLQQIYHSIFVLKLLLSLFLDELIHFEDIILEGRDQRVQYFHLRFSEKCPDIIYLLSECIEFEIVMIEWFFLFLRK